MTIRISLALLALASLVHAQKAADPSARILGMWFGTSTCVKIPENSACRDERVVYDVRAIPSRTGVVTMAAYKIVDGKREFMGALDLTWDPKTDTWSAPFKSGRGEIIWSYQVKGERMTGTCVLHDVVLRHVDVHR